MDANTVGGYVCRHKPLDGGGLLASAISSSDVAPNGDIYIGVAPYIYKSTDGGTSWSNVFTVTGATVFIRRIFCSNNGDVFVSGQNATSPGLWKINGTPTQVLTLTGKTMIWGMDEDASGNLYAGEYSTSPDGAARIWKSTDNGDTWDEKFSADLGASSIDHIHDLRVDPTTGYIYATIGDPTTDTLLRSVDAGENWTVVVTGGDQLLAITFLDGYVYVGSDRASGGEKIYRFTDDGSPTVTLESFYTLPSAKSNPVYFANSYNGKIFFGCSNEHTNETSIFVYDGSRWSEVYTATLAPNWWTSRHDYNGTFFVSTGNALGIKYTP